MDKKKASGGMGGVRERPTNSRVKPLENKPDTCESESKRAVALTWYAGRLFLRKLTALLTNYRPKLATRKPPVETSLNFISK